MADYRIIERAPNEFIIEKKVIEFVGFFWFKKQVESWRRIISESDVLFDFCYYESLEEAKEAVRCFKGDRITYID